MNHEKCVRARGVEGERARLTWSVLVLIGVLVGAPAVAAAVLPGNWRPPTDAPPARGCAAPEADLPPPAAAPAVPDGGVPRRLNSVEDVGWAVVSRPNATNLSASALPLRRTSSAQPERQGRVKRALQHAWAAYVRHAWGEDEVDPVRQIGIKSFGMATTLVDSLDTLCAPPLSPLPGPVASYPAPLPTPLRPSPRASCRVPYKDSARRARCRHLLGLDAEFRQAVAWVAESLHFGEQEDINVFEVTIRVLGGLLSAYELSDEPVLLERAEQLANQAHAACLRRTATFVARRLQPSTHDDVRAPCSRLTPSRSPTTSPAPLRVPNSDRPALRHRWPALSYAPQPHVEQGRIDGCRGGDASTRVPGAFEAHEQRGFRGRRPARDAPPAADAVARRPPARAVPDLHLSDDRRLCVGGTHSGRALWAGSNPLSHVPAEDPTPLPQAHVLTPCTSTCSNSGC